MYVVKMDGMKVRMFDNMYVARSWANKHCSGEVEIVSLRDVGRLPRAEKDTSVYADERAIRNFVFYGGVTVGTV